MNIRLTDEQYGEILKKILAKVSEPGFKKHIYDSTCPGDKYTESNCGFCNEEYTTIDTALFPEQFPERKSMKYREVHHRCPFDKREKPTMNGCYYTCVLRKEIGTNKSLVELAEKALSDYATIQDNSIVI